VNQVRGFRALDRRRDVVTVELDPRLEATEILVTPEMACIVAVRRS
jgi:hypothetical protein